MPQHSKRLRTLAWWMNEWTGVRPFFSRFLSLSLLPLFPSHARITSNTRRNRIQVCSDRMQGGMQDARRQPMHNTTWTQSVGRMWVKVAAAKTGMKGGVAPAVAALYSHPCHCWLSAEGIISHLDTFEIKHKDLNFAPGCCAIRLCWPQSNTSNLDFFLF